VWYREMRVFDWSTVRLMRHTDEEFCAYVADRLAGLSEVRAVTLGGSRASGTHRPDSDWDFAVYYRGSFDPAGLRGLGWPGEVFEIGGWGGGVFNGGAGCKSTVDAPMCTIVTWTMSSITSPRRSRDVSASSG
jgi:Polymerase beta, Nucleotidyltransferase